MDEFEKNAQTPENSEEQFVDDSATEQEAPVYEENEPAYNANIPGPTQYDKAQRTYLDALEREKQEPSSDSAPATGSQRRIHAILSLTFGIISFILSFIPILGWLISFGMSIAGIILGAFGIKSEKRTHSIVGLVLSILALVITILFGIALIVFIILALLDNGNAAGYYRFDPFSAPDPFSYYFHFD